MVAAMLESWRARLVSLTLLALALRALWVAFEPATSPQADETMWLTWGTEVLPSPEVAFSPRQLRFVFHPEVPAVPGRCAAHAGARAHRPKHLR